MPPKSVVSPAAKKAPASKPAVATKSPATVSSKKSSVVVKSPQVAPKPSAKLAAVSAASVVAVPSKAAAVATATCRVVDDERTMAAPPAVAYVPPPQPVMNVVYNFPLPELVQAVNEDVRGFWKKDGKRWPLVFDAEKRVPVFYRHRSGASLYEAQRLDGRDEGGFRRMLLGAMRSGSPLSIDLTNPMITCETLKHCCELIAPGLFNVLLGGRNALMQNDVIAKMLRPSDGEGDAQDPRRYKSDDFFIVFMAESEDKTDKIFVDSCALFCVNDKCGPRAQAQREDDDDEEFA